MVVEENNLSAQISALRRALGPDVIATVTGRGYRFTLLPKGRAPGGRHQPDGAGNEIHHRGRPATVSNVLHRNLRFARKSLRNEMAKGPTPGEP